MAALPRTPSGQTLEKLRRAAREIESNPKMRRAIAAVVKAMGLPDPLPQEKERRARNG